jgi:hypothetical protein
MKKIYIIASFVFISLAMMAQGKKVTWDYPVKPGMEEWSQFKSMDETYKSCQIPDEIIKKLDTESLVDICLDFPVKPIFPFFNIPQEGFMSYYYNFNGIRELFDRKDAGHYLLERYASMSLSDFNPLWPMYRQGQFISYYKFVEAILAQPQIIQSLDAKDQKILLKETIRKLDEKKSKRDLFSDSNLEINLWVMGKALYADDKLSSQVKDQRNIQMFLETGLSVDLDINSLCQQAKKHAYENENE